MKPFALLSDMDGVLIETTSYILTSMKKVIHEDRLPITEEDERAAMGLSMRDKLALWGKKYNTPMPDPVTFSKRAAHYEIAEWQKEYQRNPALFALLDDLQNRKIPLAVGTASTKWRAHEFLKLGGLAHYFQIVITAEDVTHHKPHPEVWLVAAEKLGIAPNRCVIIDDAGKGIDAGLAAGMKTIGLRTAYQKPEQLAHAHLVISQFNELSYEKLLSLVNN